MVYNLFCASDVAQRLARIPVYATFCAVWNAQCNHIKLKKAMRFTKCDICTLANEALDERRWKGGASWRTEEMDVILRNLKDRHEVRFCTFFFNDAEFGLLVSDKQGSIVIFV